MKQEIWKSLEDYFCQNLEPEAYEIWFSPIKPKSVENGILKLEVPNRFHATWFEKNAKKKALEIVSSVDLDIVDIEISWADEPSSAHVLAGARPGIPASQTTDIPAKTSFFNNKYMFDRFVVGPTNRFAHASSLAVAQNPGKQFNPLFLYGNAGLGKTHLLHAVGQQITRTKNSVSVIYVSSETFINDFINSLKNQGIENFRTHYRSADCLLIDDVQFLMGKERSEEEFFHTFNTLFESNRQIILTSDRPPRELNSSQERLISRFEWGVVADIKPPDFETRLAILRKKAELENISVPDAITQYLAQNIHSNVRLLEGSMNSLVAYSCLTGAPMSMDTAEQILKQLKDDLSSEAALAPSISQIQEIVAKHYHLDLEDLKGKSRSASKVLPRQIAMFLAKTLTGRSLVDVGHAFGGKDHATVIHAVNKITSLAKIDPFFSQLINKLEKEIAGYVKR
ncbi:chromosomal replication initiator protein DnaA [Elusimicrobiota bacterium]